MASSPAAAAAPVAYLLLPGVGTAPQARGIDITTIKEVSFWR
jgi:hypothetical protein